MKRSAFYFLTVVLFATPVFAHDAALHKGPMIQGKLASIQGDKAQLDTGKEKVTVLLTSETKFEAGEEGKPATKADLKPGSDLMVHGHKLDSGEFGATEVLINAGHHDEGEEHTHEGADAHPHDSKCQ